MNTHEINVQISKITTGMFIYFYKMDKHCDSCENLLYICNMFK